MNRFLIILATSVFALSCSNGGKVSRTPHLTGVATEVAISNDSTSARLTVDLSLSRRTVVSAVLRKENGDTVAMSHRIDSGIILMDIQNPVFWNQDNQFSYILTLSVAGKRKVCEAVTIRVPIRGMLPFQDRKLSPEERADDLLSRLTLQEKTGLTMNGSKPVARLGIKAYNWWNEALHGVGRNGSATTFPEPIGMAASFDEPLLYDVFCAVSDEARVKYRQAALTGSPARYEGLTFWTPNINIFRDPRWGRGMETYGEDPYLTARLGSAVVRGLQGPDNALTRKLHGCAKHYAVHSGPESLRHSFDVCVSERDLWETYLPAFRELVTKAGVEEVMTAYNRYDGKPCSASDYLIDSLLRGEWGYKGIITSDCGAVSDFWRDGCHGYAPDRQSAAAIAVRAGVDTECGSVYSWIPKAVEDSLLNEADLDRNLRRLIIARIKLGEFDGLDPWAMLADSIVEGEAHKALALKMTRESIVLLQNRNNILPLKEDAKIAILGPNADDAQMMWGNYNAIPKQTITLRQALDSRCNGVVPFVKGCGLTDGAENIDDILSALTGIDTVIFAGGISPRLEGEEMRVEIPGFSGGDRTDIELPAVQRELLRALHDAGKKIVFVNFSGSAIGMVPETQSCEAIIQAWYPGQMGGIALAEVLYGDVNPSGKLPVTFYRSAEQLPAFVDYNMTGHTYRYFKGDALYDFGYGLSYTEFKTGKARISRKGISIPVSNTGNRDGETVIQLYVSRPDDADGPVRTLRGFARVNIKAGKKASVFIPFNESTFEWWDPSTGRMNELKGEYRLEYGFSSSSSDLKTRKYNLR